MTQAVLLILATKMRDFAYDPQRSFRAWLKTVARHAWLAFLEGRERPGRGSGDSRVFERLCTQPAREALLARLDEAFDRELLAEASARVRLRVEPRTWEAFVLTAEQGLSGAEVSARLGMRASQVYVARRRVQRLLQEVIAELEGPATG